MSSDYEAHLAGYVPILGGFVAVALLVAVMLGGNRSLLAWT